MTEKRSNTTPKQRGGVTGKGFVKGDPRINRNGRPKSFDQLRTLAQEIAHEVAKDKTGNEVVVSGKRATVAEMILRQMATDPKRQQTFLEISYGKVPQPVEMSMDKELIDLFSSLPQKDRAALAALFPDMSLPREGIEA